MKIKSRGYNKCCTLCCKLLLDIYIYQFPLVLHIHNNHSFPTWRRNDGYIRYHLFCNIGAKNVKSKRHISNYIVGFPHTYHWWCCEWHNFTLNIFLRSGDMRVDNDSDEYLPRILDPKEFALLDGALGETSQRDTCFRK